MTVNPFLQFPGTCAEAMTFYQQRLGATGLFVMTFGESPMATAVPADWHDKVIYAKINIGTTTLMAADAMPDRYQRPAGFYVALSVDEPEAAERAFAALAEGASVGMPLQETFWAQRFGTLTDRFGIPWTVDCAKPEQP